jgi:integrase
MEDANLEIMDDPYFKNFIKTKNLSKSSERVYSGRLRAFFEFINKNPSELIKEAQIENMKINKYFLEYIENLKKSGKSNITIINRMDTVKAFYKEYDIDTEGINRIVSPLTDIYLKPNDIISQDQIQDALELSSLRDKAIILLHMSSGMEANELRHLSYGDFLNSIEEYVDIKPEEVFNIKKIEDKLNKMDQIVGTWKIEKNRTKRPYVTFNTPESTRAILSYLIDRERKNKPITSLEDPLFVNSQNQALNISAHGSIFKRINNRANFGYITRKRRFFSSTMLRKYFKAKLYESEVDEKTIKSILGQQLNTDINYPSDDEIKELKTKYRGILNDLSIERVNIETVTSKEYNNLIKQLHEKDKELEEIKKHLNHIKHIIE